MSIFSKVTLKTLVKNRVRTIVTVAGILLSAAMITAVTTSVVSFQRYLQGTMTALNGNWHVVFFNVDAEGREDLESDARTASAAWAQVDWALVSDGPDGASAPAGATSGEPGGQETDSLSLCVVLGADPTFMERMPVALSQGRLPENSNEIVLSQVMLGGQETALGDTVTLELGERTVEGQTLGFGNGPHLEDETVRVRETRTFTVVGYLEDTRFDQNSGADIVCLTRWDEDCEALQNGWLLLNKPRDTFQMQLDYQTRFGSSDNRDLLMTLGVTRYSTFNAALSSFAAILIGLIMFGSVSLIYNAFSISVAQRTKQFGLLRSVGATKKQLRSMVFTEAFAVSAVGIPLGLLSGILGMAVTFHFIGAALGRLLSDTVNDTLGAPVFTLRLTPFALVAAAVIGLVTVLISAWIPSRRAMRVSAVEAIRESQDVRIKPREVKTSPLTYRLFGLEGAIAGKHFKRNRKGYRATVVSLFMSVVLFISASSFCRYLTDTVYGLFNDFDHDICLHNLRSTVKPGETNINSADLPDLIQTVSQVPCVTGASGFKVVMNSSGCLLTQDQVPERTWDVLMRDAEEDTLSLYVEILGVEDSVYRAYLQKMGLSEAEYMGEHPKIVLCSTVEGFNPDAQRFERFEMIRADIGTLDLRFSDELAILELWESAGYQAMTPEEQTAAEEAYITTETYEVGLVTEELPLGLNGNNERNSVTVLLPLAEAQRLEEGRSRWDQTVMYLTVSDHQQGLSDITSALNDAGYTFTDGNVTDLYQETANQRSLITVVRVISTGFITLISLIAALNVFNTISTNILLRRREFAMLRSVGMTNRGFNRMMNFECLLYGAKSLLYGIPAAFGVTYLIYRGVMEGMDTSFYLPWSAVAVAVGSVFLVVFLSMMYSMAGIKRDNPIEAMKNEVI